MNISNALKFLNGLKIDEDDSDSYLTFISNKNSSSIKLINKGNPTTLDLWYKKNNNSWIYYTINTVINLDKNDKVSFWNQNNKFSLDQSNYYYFVTTGNVDIKGNLMSLLNFSKNLVNNYQFTHLFKNCDAIYSANKLLLPANGLSYGCYGYMFWNCSNLVNAPELPAPSLSEKCYECMFYGCTSLISAPILSAFQLNHYCYKNMFNRCSSLSNTQTELSAKTLKYECYLSMFNGCSSLSSAPKLPAKILRDHCYKYMFKDCSSLIIAPKLPATTLLQQSYREMFYGCVNLSSITVGLTGWNDTISGTDNWLSGVSNSGLFICPSALPQIKDQSHIPITWTIDKKYLNEVIIDAGVDEAINIELRNNQLYSALNNNDPGTHSGLKQYPHVYFGHKACLVDDDQWNIQNSRYYTLPFNATSIAGIELIYCGRNLTKISDTKYSGDKCQLSLQNGIVKVIDSASSSSQYKFKIIFN